MQNIKKFGKNNKKTYLIVMLIFAIALATLITLEKSRATDFIKNPFYKSAAQVNEQATKDDPTSNSKSTLPPATPGVDTNKTTNEIPTASTASINITELSQSEGQITYAAQISGLSSSGVCSATFTSAGTRPVVRSTQLINSTCGPVSIPKTEFTQLGNWTLTLRYFADNQQVETKKDLQIQ